MIHTEPNQNGMTKIQYQSPIQNLIKTGQTYLGPVTFRWMDITKPTGGFQSMPRMEQFHTNKTIMKSL
jgi:hypothetical protein